MSFLYARFLVIARQNEYCSLKLTEILIKEVTCTECTDAHPRGNNMRCNTPAPETPSPKLRADAEEATKLISTVQVFPITFALLCD